jgi:hypothetical protein
VLGCALSDFKREARRVTPYHLTGTRFKFVEEVEPRVTANRRAKIVERRRSGAGPVRAASIVDSNPT